MMHPFTALWLVYFVMAASPAPTPFHKSPKIKNLIESVGCALLYLPPYSPDLNPIEKYWSNLKKRLKKLGNLTTNFFQKLTTTLNTLNTSPNRDFYRVP